MEEGRKKRKKLINEFFELPEDVILEILELGKTRIIKEPSTGYITRYWFNIGEERYNVRFMKNDDNFYEMGFVFDKEAKDFTGLTYKYQASRIYSGLLDAFKMFIEEHNPKEITMNITSPKSAEHFSKVIKIAFKKYNNIFGDYKVKGIKKKNIDDFLILNILTIERKR